MKRFLFRALWVLLGAVVAVGLWWVGDSYLVPFNSNTWKAEEANVGSSFDPIGTRRRLFRRLVRQYQLEGMSRAQLLELLGKPSESLKNGDVLYYRMDGFGYFTVSSLVFEFKAGRVESYYFVED